MALNVADVNDVQLNVGFMTLKQSLDQIRVSIMSTGNDGNIFSSIVLAYCLLSSFKLYITYSYVSCLSLK